MAKIYGLTKCETDYINQFPQDISSMRDAKSIIKSLKTKLVNTKNKQEEKGIQRTLSKLGKIKALYTGADGEARTVERLLRLPKNYSIIGGVQICQRRGGQVDVFVVGPTGTFCLEVKNRKKCDIEAPGQAAESARMLESHIGKVTPVLVDLKNVMRPDEKHPEVRITGLGGLNELILDSNQSIEKTRVRKLVNWAKSNAGIQ